MSFLRLLQQKTKGWVNNTFCKIIWSPYKNQFLRQNLLNKEKNRQFHLSPTFIYMLAIIIIGAILLSFWQIYWFDVLLKTLEKNQYPYSCTLPDIVLTI